MRKNLPLSRRKARESARMANSVGEIPNRKIEDEDENEEEEEDGATGRSQLA